jgi:hypothetical protein
MRGKFSFLAGFVLKMSPRAFLWLHANSGGLEIPVHCPALKQATSSRVGENLTGWMANDTLWLNLFKENVFFLTEN